VFGSIFITLRWFGVAHISVQVITILTQSYQSANLFNRKLISSKYTHSHSWILQAYACGWNAERLKQELIKQARSRSGLSKHFVRGPHELLYNSSRAEHKLRVQNKRISKHECYLVIKVHLSKVRWNCFFGFSWENLSENLASDGMYLILTKTSDCGNIPAKVTPACSAP